MKKLTENVAVVWSLVNGHRAKLLLTVLLSFVQYVAGASLPVALGWMVAAVGSGSASGALVSSVVMVGAVLVRVSCSVTVNVLETRAGIEIALDHKSRIARHAMATNTVAASDLSVGDVIEIADDDVDGIAGTFSALRRIMVCAATYVVVGVYLVSQFWLLGIGVMLGVPMLCGVLPPVLSRLEQHLESHRVAAGVIASMASDAAVGHRVLSGVRGQSVFLTRFSAASTRMRDAGLREAGIRALIDGLREAIPAVIVLTIVGVGLVQWSAGIMPVSALVSLYGLGVYLMQPVTTFIEALEEWSPAVVGARREQHVFQTAPTDSIRAGNRAEPGKIEDASTGLRVSTRTYSIVTGSRLNELRTLAARLAGADGAHAAGVKMSGVELSQCSDESIRDCIMLLDVDARPISGTIREILGDSSRNDDERVAALNAVSAVELLDVGGGLERYVEESGTNLSGGQRQRLLLAQVLLAQPPILLLVEPTSALDVVTEQQVIQGIRSYRRDQTTVVFTRDVTHMRSADDVNMLVDGQVALHGTHRELMKDERYSHLVEQVALV